MAVIKPSIVVTNASEIPFAIVLGSPVPNKVIAWKVLIIPVIVPNKPSNGATTEISLTNQIPVSIEDLSTKICSASFNSKVSTSDPLFCSATSKILERGLLPNLEPDASFLTFLSKLKRMYVLHPNIPVASKNKRIIV